MAKWNIKVFEPAEFFDGERVTEYADCTEFHVHPNTGIRSFLDSLGVKHVMTCRFHAVRVKSDGTLGAHVGEMMREGVGA